MGLSALFEGGSLMYINWQTAPGVGAVRKEACRCVWVKGTTEGSWQVGRQGAGRGKGRVWVGRAQEVRR